jgi:hypothetical protein
MMRNTNPASTVPARTFGLLAGCAFLGASFLGVCMSKTVAAQDREVRITVYNDNLGLVTDRRPLDLSKGRFSLEIADVPAKIDPTSVHLVPQEGDLEVLEQNFQYDLAGPDRILQRYVDQPVEAVLKEGELKTGTLLSYEGGSLVLRGDDGGISLVQRDQVVDVRLPSLPEGLRTRPTLVWELQSSSGGRRPVELTYLTGGLSWHAEYVAVTNDDDSKISLSAWISLENTSGATYPDARLQLIAGDVHRVQKPQLRKMAFEGQAMAVAPSAGFAEESFFEYHLYTLDRPTTIADRETKQVSLFPTTSAPVKKIYEYNGRIDPTKVRVVLEAENRKELGLGMPLPAGKVRTYKEDSRGDLQFIGEDQIDHTPKDEKIRLGIGNAFDVVGERKELSQTRVSDRVYEKQIEIRIRNHKEEAVQVVVDENLYGDWTILRSSHEHTKKDAHTAEFQLDVGAGDEEVLTFTVRLRS